jgi:mRNA-degrading endonuclease RelE of RelBE toxin-antitoxin system
MKYRMSNTFRSSFQRLPRDIQKVAVEKFKLFKENPYHPSLKTHKLGGSGGIIAGHITESYVFTFRVTRDDSGERICESLDIGKHVIYGR